LFPAELRLPVERLHRLCRVPVTRGKTAMSENTETAILAGGCFWPAQQLLRHRAGVISTRVGYTGGENDNPTAGNHLGHAEAVEVIFDPGQTSYRNILEARAVGRDTAGASAAGTEPPAGVPLIPAFTYVARLE
jgi:hypothetical protein